MGEIERREREGKRAREQVRGREGEGKERERGKERARQGNCPNEGRPQLDQWFLQIAPKWCFA